MTTPINDYYRSIRGGTTLWVGILGGPTAWFVNQQINLLLVPWACSSGHLFVLHLVSLACLLATVGAGWLAWRNWGRVHQSTGDDDETTISRARFMAFLGLMSAGLFVLVIIAQDLPNFILDPCKR